MSTYNLRNYPVPATPKASRSAIADGIYAPIAPAVVTASATKQDRHQALASRTDRSSIRRFPTL